MRTVIVIPARFKSSRYPGKPLVAVAGRTMIERVYRIACAVEGVNAVHVATDDERIREAAEGFGAPVVMTSSEARNGTERVAEAVAALDGAFDLAVNLQGDAPLTPPHFIRSLIDAMDADPAAEMATAAVRCDAETLAHFQEDRRRGRVGGTTVACANDGTALYFSKEVIPYVPPGPVPEPIPVFHHVGLYAYRTGLLRAYRQWAPGRLEALEGLEQLRVLENGRRIKVVEVDAGGRPFWEINNPEDVARIEGVIARFGDVL